MHIINEWFHYRWQRSCGKVMFLHVPVILLTGVGVSVRETPQTETPGQRTPRQRSPWTETPWTETPLDREPPGQRTPVR